MCWYLVDGWVGVQEQSSEKRIRRGEKVLSFGEGQEVNRETRTSNSHHVITPRCSHHTLTRCECQTSHIGPTLFFHHHHTAEDLTAVDSMVNAATMAVRSATRSVLYEHVT